MGKSITSTVLDAMLAAAEGDRISVCSAEPTTGTQAATTYFLAGTTLTGGDFTKAAGDTNGRKNTVAAKTSVSITNTGDATHIAIYNNTGPTLIRVTTCTTQALTSGGTVTIGAHKHELNNPT
jgi:hypothetical protein